MSSLVLDTGGLYALLDEAEPAHDRCVATLDGFDELVLPPLVLVEVDYWCRKAGGGVKAFQQLVDDVAAGAYRLEDLTADDLRRAAELEVSYRNLDLGLVDASVVALMERLDERHVLTLDRRDFSIVRPRHCVTLRLLPD
ncbi:MAG: PIN domain-containing protein [Candidatus Dormibacteraeota bacterium]|nr:PIN domain-containing protein [Candidatus Dormibacteraeota bacterium]